jgi:uncharacterized protein (TIGR02680 family)
MDNRWLISRIGLVNFWYYDEEEFQFSGGRLLLRGANGSGKSVTMQSFIPLMLDGNRSPERLDPFGSRARKLEDYLLGEDELGEDERTGYLYMEFFKEESGNYLTLGIGLHGKRGKALDFWGFSITDGRRVGRNFFLYKNLGEKVPLSKTELKNRLAEGGQMHERPRDYMSMVNSILFGFENLDDYDELIKLLVQLRTPKLSKDFKPTVIYDILNNSLQSLSDEDLRPMSEAIENMDNIKSQLDMLRESRKAAARLGKDYDKYNGFLLWEKAKNFFASHQELSGKEKQARILDGQISEYQEQHLDAEGKLQDLKSTQNALELKRQELAQHDSFRFLREIEERTKTVDGALEDQVQKKKNFESKEDRSRKLHDQLLREQADNSLRETGLVETLTQMAALAEEFQFHEHYFLQDEIRAKMNEEYSWGLVKSELLRHRERITTARKKIQSEQEQIRIYDQAYGELEQAKREQEEAQVNLGKIQNRLLEIKEEFIEKVYLWKKQNRLLQPDEATLVQLQRIVNAFPERSYDDILGVIRATGRLIESRLHEERSRSLAEQNKWQEDLDEKERELALWLKKKEPEPCREEKVRLNRERLSREDIPFIPFYQAVEFKETVPDRLRGRIEEALMELGLLDTLIVPEKYQEKLFQMDPEMADRYLFPKLQLLTADLTNWLRPVAAADSRITADLIDSAIRSVILEKGDDLIYLTEAGEYGIGGLVKGKASAIYQPKFVGVEARKRYRQEIITGLQGEISVIKAKLVEVVAQITAVEEQLQLVQKEIQAFPDKAGLEAIAADLQEARLTLDHRFKIVNERTGYVDRCYQLLQQIREEIRALTFKLGIPLTIEAFETAESAATDYSEQLRELETGQTRYLSSRQLIRSLEEQRQETEHDLENIRYDLDRLERLIGQEQKIIQQYREMLEKLDHQAVKQAIEECLSRLQVIPNEIKTEIERSKEGVIKSEQAGKELVDLKREIEFRQKVEEIYRTGFEQEYRLGYVLQYEGITDSISLSRKIMEELSDLGRDHKSREDYLTSLQERYHENRSYLSEYNLVLEYLFNTDELIKAELKVAASRETTGDPLEFDQEKGVMQPDFSKEEELIAIRSNLRRLEIRARVQGKEVNFPALVSFLEESISENDKLLQENDRQLFEDILANTISKKIRTRIYHSEQWVKKMNHLMEAMNTSSGLSFSLVWKSKEAEHEEELPTRELVDLLKLDVNLLRPADFQKLSAHFRVKIVQARKELEEKGEARSFHALMKNILDYRQWFEFQLFFTKTGERKRELTNNAFDKFSGGEKAMAMYVPLFSAVYARYEGARQDSPRLVSLDEAFAGVDENNIRDMFRLLEELKLNFIINSQSLWGDYDTVPSLAICELVRPNNANFVSVIRYRWNGELRELITGEAVG